MLTILEEVKSMNTVTRHGVKSQYIAPELVPAFSRRWERAMSALNTADDQRHLVDVTSQDAAEDRAAFEAKLVELDRGLLHATLARFTAQRNDTAARPSYTAPAIGSIVTNGPNTLPSAHIVAVGFEVAA